jgi:hypothetical protein
VSLLVEAGSLYSGQKWLQQPLPYGPKPRLGPEAKQVLQSHAWQTSVSSPGEAVAGNAAIDHQSIRLFRLRPLALVHISTEAVGTAGISTCSPNQRSDLHRASRDGKALGQLPPFGNSPNSGQGSSSTLLVEP